MAQKHLILTCLAALLTSCAASMMTKPVYNTIPIGMRVEEVALVAGQPYKVEQGQNGLQYYKYIERVEIGPGRMVHNTYVLTIADGMVVNKQIVGSDTGSVSFSTP